MPTFHATTIVCIRRNGRTVVAGDGQVTMGATVMKAGAKKVRRLKNGKIIAGFAGSAADGFTLFELFEKKVEQFQNSLSRAAVELARDWRTDRMLRRLEALLIVADDSDSFLISGTGDVIAPDDGLLAIGSGGNFAISAARALLRHTDLDARAIAEASMRIAAEICVYTNENIHVEELGE